MQLNFFSGLAFFSLGLAALLETRRSSNLRIGKQLPFLAVFGLLLGVHRWAYFLFEVVPGHPYNQLFEISTYVLLPLSTLFLFGFGLRVALEAGALPRWIYWIPPVLFVPLGILLGQAMVLLKNEPSFLVSVEVWTQYLLFFPACLVAAFGFLHQRNTLFHPEWKQARRFLFGTALAFIFSAFVGIWSVPATSYGITVYINRQTLLSLTGMPGEVWQLISALIVTFFVIRTLSIFEVERKQEMAKIEEMHLQERENAVIALSSEARKTAENWTEALVGISRQIVEVSEVDVTLREIVRVTRELLNADVALLGLWDETCSRLNVKCFATQHGAELGAGLEITDQTLIVQLLNGKQSLIPGEYKDERIEITCPVLSQKLRAAAITPLLLDNQQVGGLWVGRLREDHFSAADLIGLQRLADQAVILLTHAQMASQLQSLAVIEERSRIAREMHDGLAQILAYLTVEMQTVQYLLKAGDQQRATAVIDQARRNIKQAHDDVRDNILSLRTTLSGEVGFVPALREYLGEYSIQTGIQVKVDCCNCEDTKLSPIAETQMVRIIQEALTNIRKHSNAKTAHVRLEKDPKNICVMITDDGIGFHNTPQRGHLGLEIMQERAESVGGRLTVTSNLGAGTRVELWLPIMNAQPHLR
jgi:signal transduction histidine kinase